MGWTSSGRGGLWVSGCPNDFSSLDQFELAMLKEQKTLPVETGAQNRQIQANSLEEEEKRSVYGLDSFVCVLALGDSVTRSSHARL